MLLIRGCISVLVNRRSVALKWVSTSPLTCVLLILRYSKGAGFSVFICHKLVGFNGGEIFCLG